MKTEDLIDRSKIEIVTRREGVGTYGLYLEFATVDSAENLLSEHRYFLSQNILSTYRRVKHENRAGWTPKAFDSHLLAWNYLNEDLSNRIGEEYPRTFPMVLLRKPVLVELVASDLEQISSGLSPQARNLGPALLTRLYGKTDNNQKIELDYGDTDEHDS